MTVFLLHHVHEMPGDEEDAKLIGVYSSREIAEQARDRALRLPGFRDFPEGFIIDSHELDSDNWSEGFVTVVPGEA